MNPLFQATAALLLSFAPPFMGGSPGTGGSPVTATSPADGLKREQLPADVDFVFHLDVEGLKRTEMWKVFQETAGAEMEAEFDELDEFKAQYGFDPLTDIKAVTLYKMKAEEDPTVALFCTSAHVDQALLALSKEAGYARVQDGGIEFHTWHVAEDAMDETVHAYVHPLPNGERLVVAAKNRASALRAARVLRGEEPNHLAGGALLVNPAPGSFLYVSASDVEKLAEFTPASQVFGLAQGIQVDLGEAGGFLRAHLSVLTEMPEKARQIADVVQGLVSLGGLALAGQELEPALEVLRALRINTKGSEVSVDFEFGVRRLVDIVTQLSELEDSEDEDEAEIEVEAR